MRKYFARVEKGCIFATSNNKRSKQSKTKNKKS
nr:MAG TPA_asm: hypothetical protein [Caudoviricetes sp.]